MNGQQNSRRGVAVGLATLTGLTGLAAAGLGVFSIAERADLVAEQRDVALVNGAVLPGADAIDAVHQQTLVLSSQFQSDIASQAGGYFGTEAWAGKDLANWLLNVGNRSDPYWSVYNGATTRFDEAALVAQGIQQAQFDHATGVNATLGGASGTAFGSLYEAQIGSTLYSDIEGSGVSPTSAVGKALADLQTAYTVPNDDGNISASGFLHAMQNLQTALSNNGWADLFGTGPARDPASAGATAVLASDAASVSAAIAGADAVIAVGQQAQLLSSEFTNDIASQAGYYYWVESWAGKGLANWLLNVGSLTDPQFSVYNGATTRFDEAALVAQGIQQAQWDHMVGINATLGGPNGNDVTNLYEYQLGSVLYSDISGSGIQPGSPLATALAELHTAYTVPDSAGFISYSGFIHAMQDLQNALSNNAWADLFGQGAAHSAADAAALSAAEAGSAAADAAGSAASGVDLPF